jgi:hypothetical protein
MLQVSRFKVRPSPRLCQRPRRVAYIGKPIGDQFVFLRRHLCMDRAAYQIRRQQTIGGRRAPALLVTEVERLDRRQERT